MHFTTDYNRPEVPAHQEFISELWGELNTDLIKPWDSGPAITILK